MNRRRAVVGAVIGLAVLLLGSLVVLTRPAKPSPPQPVTTPKPTVSLNPEQLTLDGYAREFIEKWGTYSYLSFPSYPASVKPFITDALYQEAFKPQVFQARLRSLQRTQFSIVTKPVDTEIVDIKEAQAVVRISVREGIEDKNGKRSDRPTYLITYVRSGEIWKVSKVEIEK